jgi:hypothetical protein
MNLQTNHPLIPNSNDYIIYKKFGWKNWDVYLGLDSEMSIRKIRSIIQKENINRIKQNLNLIYTKKSYQEFVKNNLHLITQKALSTHSKHNPIDSIDDERKSFFNFHKDS